MQRLAGPAIVDASSPPVCTSCRKALAPHEKGVSFPCPSCGKFTVWRCYRCRIQGNTYRCPNCGFEGP